VAAQLGSRSSNSISSRPAAPGLMARSGPPLREQSVTWIFGAVWEISFSRLRRDGPWARRDHAARPAHRRRRSRQYPAGARRAHVTIGARTWHVPPRTSTKWISSRSSVPSWPCARGRSSSERRGISAVRLPVESGSIAPDTFTWSSNLSWARRTARGPLTGRTARRPSMRLRRRRRPLVEVVARQVLDTGTKSTCTTGIELSSPPTVDMLR